MAAKKKSTKKKPQAKRRGSMKDVANDLAKAAGIPNRGVGAKVVDEAIDNVIPGVKEARENAKGKGGKPKNFMDEQAEDDRTDAKTKKAQGCVKRAHALIGEGNRRLVTARLVTSPDDAVRHDVQRTIDCIDNAKEELEEALEVMAR